MTAEDRSVLRPSLRVYGRAETLWACEASLDSLFIVRYGSVRLSYVNMDGDENIVSILGAGQCVGIDALFDRRKEILAATARQITEVCVVGIGTLRSILTRMGPLLTAILREHSEALSCRTLNLTLRTEARARNRLCTALDAQVSHLAGAIPGVAPLTQRELAAITGLREETVSRQLRPLLTTEELRGSLRSHLAPHAVEPLTHEVASPDAPRPPRLARPRVHPG